MDQLNLRRIRCADPRAAQQFSELRQQLHSQADVVPPGGRQLTVAVFGEALPPSRVVERICTDVRTRGLAALLLYTQQLDGVTLPPETLRVSAAELSAAHAAAEAAFLE